MKAIQITFEGIVKPYYSVIKDVKRDFCYLSDRAVSFIRAQSIDNNVYYGTDPIYPLGECDKEITGLFCLTNGDKSVFYIKAPAFDTNNPFAAPKKGEWQWKKIEICVIDIMD